MHAAAHRLSSRWRAPLTCALLVVALAPGRSDAFLPPAYGGSLTLPLTGQVVTLAPWAADRPAELALAALLYDTLYRMEGRRLVPHLVVGAPKLTDGGRTWRLRLRAGVVLHDGRELTAADVARSLDRTRRGLHRFVLAGVLSVSHEGKSVMVFRLRTANARLPWQLSARAAAIAVRRGNQLIGSGPFRLHRRLSAGLDLQAHALHFAGRPYLDRLRFKLFARTSDEVASYQIGSSQLSFHGVSVFGGTPRYKPELLRAAATQTLFLSFGSGRPFVLDRSLRRALAAGIDRRRLARLVGGKVAKGLVPPRIMRYRRRRGSGFDRRAAARFKRLAAARFAVLASPRVRLSLLVDKSRPDDVTLAGQLVADLDRIGFAVTIDARNAKEYQQLLHSGSYSVALRRHAFQSANARLALASALSMAGQGRLAARCVLGRCGPREARRYARQLPVIPLVHQSLRVHYDARVAGLRMAGDGTLRLADVFWLRGVGSVAGGR